MVDRQNELMKGHTGTHLILTCVKMDKIHEKIHEVCSWIWREDKLLIPALWNINHMYLFI